ncbi:MAG: glutathione peroxidase, partial [Burkholderiaceae bacterium]
MPLPLIELQRIDGTPDTLTAYSGKALLVVMGFPCNQFGGQEPGFAEEIAAFCTARFDVTFPLFQKCEVNGNGAHPLFGFLKSSVPGLLGSESIKWNFTKFLINRQGEVTR